jgi:hypothetical protein
MLLEWSPDRLTQAATVPNPDPPLWANLNERFALLARAELPLDDV